jgi:hypothetical protein
MRLKGFAAIILGLGVFFASVPAAKAGTRASLTLEARTSCQGEIREFCYDQTDWFYNRQNPIWINYVARLTSPEGKPIKDTPVFFVVLDRLHSKQYTNQKYTDANGQASYRFQDVQYEKVDDEDRYKPNDNTYRAQARVGTFTKDEEGNVQFNRDVQVWNVVSNQVSVKIDIPELYPDLPRPPVSQGSLKVDSGELSFKNASLTGGDWKYLRVGSGNPPFQWDNVYKEYGEIAPRGLWGEMGIYTVQQRTLGLLNADLLISAKPVTDTVIVTDASGNRTEVQVVIDYLTFDDVSGQLP